MDNSIQCEICNRPVTFEQYIEHCEECYIQTSIMNRNINRVNDYIQNTLQVATTIEPNRGVSRVSIIPIDIERLLRNQDMVHGTTNQYEMNTSIEEMNGGVVDVPAHNIESSYTQLDNTESGLCSICLEESDTTKPFVKTVCNHIFCKECIHKWLSIRHKCPICLHDFNQA